MCEGSAVINESETNVGIHLTDNQPVHYSSQDLTDLDIDPTTA